MFDAIRVGRQIYNMKNPSEARRCVVFVIRCLLHPQKMKRLQRFFASNEKLARIAEAYGFPLPERPEDLEELLDDLHGEVPEADDALFEMPGLEAEMLGADRAAIEVLAPPSDDAAPGR